MLTENIVHLLVLQLSVRQIPYTKAFEIIHFVGRSIIRNFGGIPKSGVSLAYARGADAINQNAHC